MGKGRREEEEQIRGEESIRYNSIIRYNNKIYNSSICIIYNSNV